MTQETDNEQQDDPDVVLAARNISKIYGSTHALQGVNFDIRRGKVTTLFGENGAGKSTLMKILSGVVTPSSGDILLNGEVKTSPRQPRRVSMGLPLFIRN